MTSNRARILGWALIAGVVALTFVLDHFRILHAQFNWFMMILLAISIGLIACVARLEWASAEGDSRDQDKGAEHSPTKEQPH